MTDSNNVPFLAGAFKASISPLVAEQYRVTALRVKTNKSGERVIVDPAYTTAQYVSLPLIRTFLFLFIKTLLLLQSTSLIEYAPYFPLGSTCGSTYSSMLAPSLAQLE